MAATVTALSPLVAAVLSGILTFAGEYEAAAWTLLLAPAGILIAPHLEVE
jgi:di/tricarboxylate transporter